MYTSNNKHASSLKSTHSFSLRLLFISKNKICCCFTYVVVTIDQNTLCIIITMDSTQHFPQRQKRSSLRCRKKVPCNAEENEKNNSWWSNHQNILPSPDSHTTDEINSGAVIAQPLECRFFSSHYSEKVPTMNATTSSSTTTTHSQHCLNSSQWPSGSSSFAPKSFSSSRKHCFWPSSSLVVYLSLLWLAALLLGPVSGVSAADCYFPPEFQGIYEMQANTDALGRITYDRLVITSTEISEGWGRCHVMDGPYAILSHTVSSSASASGKNSATAPVVECYRCFHISARTPNILQVNTESLETCYKSVEAARRKCPQPTRLHGGEGIFLWKVNSNVPGKNQQRQFCPIDGRFAVTYTLDGKLVCDERSKAVLTNCPHGDIMNVDFPKCQFTARKTQYRCLGTWQAENGQKFIGLMEQREDPQIRFRCGIYSENADTHQISIALSADSSCDYLLNNATAGFENMTLTPIPANTKRKVLVDGQTCHFPSWMQGEWFDGTSVRGTDITFQDGFNDRLSSSSNSRRTSYRATCVERNQLNYNEEKIQAFVQTQCGEEMYACLWIKKRATNVFEMKVGSTSKTAGASLCNDKAFTRSKRITQARSQPVDNTVPVQCPFAGGELLARLSDDKCARISTPCSSTNNIQRGMPLSPSIIDYIQTNCKDGQLQEVYDRRQYMCTAVWQQDKLHYIYATRVDSAATASQQQQSRSGGSSSRYCLVANITDNDTVQMLAFKDNCQYDKSPLFDGVHFARISECNPSINNNLINPTQHYRTLLMQQQQLSGSSADSASIGLNEVPGSSTQQQQVPYDLNSGWQDASPYIDSSSSSSIYGAASGAKRAKLGRAILSSNNVYGSYAAAEDANDISTTTDSSSSSSSSALRVTTQTVFVNISSCLVCIFLSYMFTYSTLATCCSPFLSLLQQQQHQLQPSPDALVN